MNLRVPRWFRWATAVVAAAFAVGFVVIVVAAWRGPWGLWVGAAVVGAAAACAAAIAVIATRDVRIADGTLHVGGWRAVSLPLVDLTGVPRQSLFGVDVGTDDCRRRVFAQLPHLTSAFVDRLSAHASQLREPLEYPVVLPGRISTPVAYGVAGALAAAMGGGVCWWTFVGDGDVSPWAAGLVGAPMFVGGIATVWWVLWRAERRVEVHADRIVRVHLIGCRTTPLGPLAAAVVVTEPRRLPKSTLERPVHRLRLVEATGTQHELAPMIAAFPDYGAGEAGLMRTRAWQIERLAGVERAGADIHRSSRGECVLWHHGESSPGALRTTAILPTRASGRRIVAMLDGAMATGGDQADVVLVDADVLVVLVDLAAGTVRHTQLDHHVRALEPGLGRIVTGDGAVVVADVAAAARPGWPRRRPNGLSVPRVTWTEALDAVLDGVDGSPTEADDVALRLVAVRAYRAAIARLVPIGDAPPPPLLAHVLELARTDDPRTVERCPGAGRPCGLGPEGRPECRTCGVYLDGGGPAREHDWVWEPGWCDGSLCAASDRAADALSGACRRCGAPGPLTHDGLVRGHRARPAESS